MKNLVLTLSLAVIYFNFGCSSKNQQTVNSDYKRGNTTYSAGRLIVKEEAIITRPERSVRGFRVAGDDTDLVTEYWDTLFVEFRATGSLYRLFEEFKARHKDLVVFGTGAEHAALSEFERWTKLRGIRKEFDDFWSIK